MNLLTLLPFLGTTRDLVADPLPRQPLTLNKKFSFLFLPFSVVLFLCLAGNGMADTIDTFVAVGTFQDGSNLSGTVTFDVTTGSTTAADLMVSAPDSMTFTFIQSEGNSVPGIFLFQIGQHSFGTPALVLGIGSPSIVGYAGGSLVSVNTPTNGYASGLYYTSTTGTQLVTGQLTLATATPEPASAVLISSALLAFGAARFRRKAGTPRR